MRTWWTNIVKGWSSIPRRGEFSLMTLSYNFKWPLNLLGVKALEWLLLTSLPVSSAEQTTAVVQCYLLRWHIERTGIGIWNPAAGWSFCSIAQASALSLRSPSTQSSPGAAGSHDAAGSGNPGIADGSSVQRDRNRGAGGFHTQISLIRAGKSRNRYGGDGHDRWLFELKKWSTTWIQENLGRLYPIGVAVANTWFGSAHADPKRRLVTP